MKNSFNLKVYNMAMIEMLINNHNTTDLGNYLLEYKFDFANINQKDMSFGDVALAVLVRLVNKENNSVEWGNIYYKVLEKNAEVIKWSQLDGFVNTDKYNQMLEEISNSSIEDKMAFISRIETKYIVKPYKKSVFIDASLAEYFDNLQGEAVFDGYPTVNINGRFPKMAISKFDEEYNNITSNLEAKRLIK